MLKRACRNNNLQMFSLAVHIKDGSKRSPAGTCCAVGGDNAVDCLPPSIERNYWE